MISQTYSLLWLWTSIQYNIKILHDIIYVELYIWHSSWGIPHMSIEINVFVFI